MFPLALDVPPEPPRYAEVRPLFEIYQNSNGYYGGQCGEFARRVTGIARQGKYVRNWKPNSNYPLIGSIALFQNHAAVVVMIIGDALVLAESNFKGDERITVGRTVLMSDPSIRGYIIPSLLASR